MARPRSRGDVLDYPAARWRSAPVGAPLSQVAIAFAEHMAAAAADTGIVIVPISIARLHQRKDVVTRVVTDLEPSTIALVWKIERDDEVTQTFVGVIKGRTANSSR